MSIQDGRFLVALLVLIPGFALADFQAGAATSNITPKMGVPLDGVIMQIGPAKDVHDELFARCLVLGDGKTKLAIVVVDNTMVSRKIYDLAKVEIERHTGIPPEHVCISATHTHSTPRAVVDLVDDELHREYLAFLSSRIADGVRRAVNRMRPARIGWGSLSEPRFVHNRRWIVAENFQALNVNPFGKNGEIVKMNPGREGLEKPAGPVDPEVAVISIQDEAGNPLAVLSAYGLHYIGGVPGGVVSADYYGVFADALKNRLFEGEESKAPPFVGMMANGTSGDVNANDLSKPRAKFAPYERMTLVGEELAGAVANLVTTIPHEDEAVSLAAVASELELKVRKPDPKRVAWADEILKKVENGKRLSRAQVYARETRYLADYPDSVSVPLQVFRIGEIAVVQIPCEVFAETGLSIKTASPFAGTTFTVELANGYLGYLPPDEQFNWGGYETWPARSSFLEEKAESKIRSRLGEMLDTLKAGE